MNIEALKKQYGEEYPAAVLMNGIRMPLQRERRFSRSYHSDAHKMGSEVSRLMDGSASITALELQSEWPHWTHDERVDFCQSCAWLHEQSDFPDMLRFVMQHSGPSEWSGIAMDVAARLPREEAFDILLRALQSTEIGHGSNIGQAIALTKHPNAEATLRRHLQAIWDHSGLWDDAQFINWVAFDATTCIANLLELGASTGDFMDHVRQLSGHVCSHNRDSCRNFLSKHYPSLQ